MTARTAEYGPDSRPAVKPGLAVARIDGETVMYAPDADALHRLDRTASVVLPLLTGESTLAALADRLAAIDQSDPADVLGYLTRLAEMLAQRGVLTGTVAAAEYTGRQRREPPTASAFAPSPAIERPLPHAPHRTNGCRALEHSFTVATNDIAVRDYLDYVFQDLRADAADAAVGYRLLTLDQQAALAYGDDVLATVDRLDRALSLLLWHINTESARSAAAHGPVVHAAAAVRRGVTVLMPAPQESGKTTTVAGLLRAGFGYLTDEAVAIDDELLARPCPKALSVDSGSWGVLADLRPQHSDRMAGQWQVPASSVRPDAVAGPAPIRFVVTPAYERDAETRLDPIPRAEALVALADSTFDFWDEPQRNLDVLSRTLAGASCYRLAIGDLADGVRLVTELVDSEQLDVAE